MAKVRDHNDRILANSQYTAKVWILFIVPKWALWLNTWGIGNGSIVYSVNWYWKICYQNKNVLFYIGVLTKIPGRKPHFLPQKQERKNISRSISIFKCHCLFLVTIYIMNSAVFNFYSEFIISLTFKQNTFQIINLNWVTGPCYWINPFPSLV